MVKKYMQRLKKDQRGLTLVELLAVVVILAIVAAIAFIVIGNVIDNSKKDAHVANAQQMISAAKLYESSTGNSIEKNSAVTVKVLREAGVLSKLQDPWKGENSDYGDDGKVRKVENDGDIEYRVTLGATKCNLADKEESALNKEGRKACN